MFIRLYIAFILILSLKSSFSQKYTEYEVKAAYLYNFAKFVKWPDKAFASDKSPFIIGVYSNDNFSEILCRILQNRTIRNRKWIIKTFNSVNEISDCHILFISEIKKTDLIEVLKFTKKRAVLTVGNIIDDFCLLGGILNFTLPQSKYRFIINNKAAIRAGLVISSKLLSLAKIVTTEEVKF